MRSKRNIVGHTNIIVVEINKELLNNGLEIRKSTKEATIGDLHIKNAVPR